MNVGNKGAITTVINFNGMFLELINCHLSAGFGNSKREQRLLDLNSVLKANHESHLHRKVLISIFLGDFNFKVNLPRQIVLETVKHGRNCYQKLKTEDEFAYYKAVHPILKNYRKANVKFPPTFKYDIHTRTFEDTPKIPSWTDRVLYQELRNCTLKILEYNSLPIYVSDHHPVYLICEVFNL